MVLSGLGLEVVPAGQPPGGVIGQLLVPEALGVGAPGKTVHVQRAAGQVRQGHGSDLRRVADQFPLADRVLTRAAGKQDLVQVGQPQVAAEHVPGAARAERVQGGQLIRAGPGYRAVRLMPGRGARRVIWGAAQRHRRFRGRQIRAPHPGRVGLDLVVGAPAEHGGREILGVPAFHGVLVVLVHQQPLVGAGPAGAHQDEPAAQLFPVHIGVELARLDRRGWIIGGVRLPGAAVPHDHVPAAVLAPRDDALEVEVLQRVVLDVHRDPLDVRIEGGPLGYRPADQDATDLETEVVVQPPGPVPLHDEPLPAAVRRPVRRPAACPAGSGVRLKSRLRWYGVSFPGTGHLPAPLLACPRLAWSHPPAPAPPRAAAGGRRGARASPATS